MILFVLKDMSGGGITSRAHPLTLTENLNDRRVNICESHVRPDHRLWMTCRDNPIQSVHLRIFYCVMFPFSLCVCVDILFRMSIEQSSGELID